MPIDASIYGQQNRPLTFNPFEGLSQMLHIRAQQENMRGLQEQRQAIAEQRRAQTEKIARENADRAAEGQAIQQGGGVRAKTLEWAVANAPNTVGSLTEFFDKADEKAANIKKLRQQAANDEADFLGDIADGMLRHGATPEAIRTGISYTVEQFPDYADAAEKMGAQLAQAAPDQVRAFLEQIRDTSPARRQKPREAPMTISPGQGVLNTQTGQYEVPIAKTPELGTLEDHIKRWAASRKLDPAKLSSAQALAATREFEAARRAPEKPEKPTYEWANVGGENKLLTPDEIRKQGGVKPMTATEALDERKYKKADPVLRGISELSERINTQQGLIAKMKGGAERIAAEANYNDDVAEYQALVSGFTPMIARALGHTGVLTQQDVDSVKALFPTPGNSKTLRDRKINRMLGIIGELEGATSSPANPTKPPASAADKDGIQKPIPGIPGGVAELRNGRWIRIK